MSDLLADLQADLATDRVASPAPGPAPAPPAPGRGGTPALDVRLTPLRWARPSLRAGVVVLGPVRVALTRA